MYNEHLYNLHLHSHQLLTFLPHLHCLSFIYTQTHTTIVLSKPFESCRYDTFISRDFNMCLLRTSAFSYITTTNDQAPVTQPLGKTIIYCAVRIQMSPSVLAVSLHKVLSCIWLCPLEHLSGLVLSSRY